VRDREAVLDHLMARILGSDDYNFRVYLKECLMRLPLEDLKSLVYERNIHILATLGNAVVNLDPVLYDPGKGHMVLIVFTANFSKQQPADILYIIAHEFAHVFLGHYDRARWKGGESELEADRRVVQWGFGRELRQAASAYLKAPDG
jgi:hypothetical protein